MGREWKKDKKKRRKKKEKNGTGPGTGTHAFVDIFPDERSPKNVPEEK